MIDPNKPVFKLLVQIDPAKWTPETGAGEVIDQLLLEGVLDHAEVVPSTLDEQTGADLPSRHRYTAHDSGFMAFAVETDGLGTYHAIVSDGVEYARTDEVRADGPESMRAAWHQLVDRVVDKCVAELTQGRAVL
jgi:hypothetical protein